MKKTGAVRLADVGERTIHIELACTRCDRRGRYRVAKLIDQFGPDFGMPDLPRRLTDCPNRMATNTSARCDVYFPKLGEIMRGEVDSEGT